MLLEDAMMAYRVVRSPERRIFYIDVGGIAEKEIEGHMQKIVTSMKRNQVIDETTGRVDLRYNPMSIDEDYFIPVRGDTSNTRVESLPGGTYTGDIDDVKYLRDKLFSALKIPASYLTQGEEGSEDKTTLAQKDIRFSRTVTRLQRSVVSELEKIAVIHLYTVGYTGKDLISFKLHLNQPSKIAELQELEHWRTKFEIAATATEGYFSRRWVGKHLLDLSDDEIVRNQREMFYDKKMDASLEQASMPDADAAGGDLAGGDLGGDELGGDELAGGDLTGEEAVPEEPLADETLLATPGKRDDLQWRRPDQPPYTTPGAKGKVYKPVKTDKRDMGARNRSYKAKYGHEKGKNTKRNIHPGLEGLQGLQNGIYENKQTNYDNKYEKQELEILKSDIEIKKIIESLEQRNKKGK